MGSHLVHRQDPVSTALSSTDLWPFLTQSTMVSLGTDRIEVLSGPGHTESMPDPNHTVWIFSLIHIEWMSSHIESQFIHIAQTSYQTEWMFSCRTMLMLNTGPSLTMFWVELQMDHIQAQQVQVAWTEPSMAFEVCDQDQTRSVCQVGGTQICIQDQQAQIQVTLELAVYPCMDISESEFVQMAAIVSQVESVVG